MPLSTRRVRLLRRSFGQWFIAVVSALGCIALFAPPATATPLPPSPNPLPDSTFQGADGNQDDDAPNIDWQALQAAGRVNHSPDPNEADSAFTGGSKEDEPGLWDFTTEDGGVSPGKANVLDAWSSVDPAGAQAFLYLGFTRQSAIGTRVSSTFLTFELNHDSRLWNNGRATIPCRRTGDLLISYQAEGNDVNVVIQRWVTSLTNATTGCATTGRLDDLTGLTPNVDAQGAVNATPIFARLPGFYDGEVPAFRFGEAAFNLNEFLADAGIDPCVSFGSIWMHSRSSTSSSSNMQDYVAPQALTMRTCAASGTKFEDRNANGRRDPGEPGLPRWTIWADYNDDGVRDDNEPFGITDSDGQYVINDIRPPDGTYMLRETLPPAARRRAAVARVRCSYPNSRTPGGGTGTAPGGMFRCGWGPISTATTTYARGRDFGNFKAAELVVRKELEPTTDPGRFNLFVNRAIVVPAAGDGGSRTLALRPGVYSVSEVATAGTNPADYRSTVECKRGVRRRQSRSGTIYENLQLGSGERAVCTFRNIRLGSPAIAIDKTGPAVAEAGDTLRYTLYVTNTGYLPFPAATVQVTDPTCDAPPQLVRKASASGPDTSPGTFDPGDTWTYACSRRTSASAGCPALVPNTATATGSAGGATVTDRLTIETELRCPPLPPQPPQPQPPAPQPPPLVPPGPKPPDANDAAKASLLFRQATTGCIRTRVPRVRFEGTRIARVQVFVNGQLRRRLTVQSLQARVTPRVLLAPGRYRLAVRITFQRGTGSPPVTLRRVIRICGASRPPFTG